MPLVIPPAWRDHVWIGKGKPIPQLVHNLRICLVDGKALPPCGLLGRWPDLEASAARAMDLHSNQRVVALLHADDPTFVSSSCGALNHLLLDVAIWTRRHRAQFHQASGKTVWMCTAYTEEMTDVQVTMPSPDLSTTVVLQQKLTHRWLGVLWSNVLYFKADMEAKLQAASSVLGQLAGLVVCRALPIALAIQVFESKVDSMLVLSRWLWITLPDAKERLNRCYEGWAKLLLGSDFWRNGAVACSEAGCSLSGEARLVRDTAMRHARQLRGDLPDFYASLYMQVYDIPEGWPNGSKKLLGLTSVKSLTSMV